MTQTEQIVNRVMEAHMAAKQEDRLLISRYVPGTQLRVTNEKYIEAIRAGAHTGECVHLDDEFFRITKVNEVGIYGHRVCPGCGDPFTYCTCKEPA